MAGIIGYGVSLPYMRISVDDIQPVWKNTPLEVLKNVLKVNERAVLQPNEDTITLAIDASRKAIQNAGISRESIDALFLGTCTNPYDSKPSITTIAEAIGTRSDVMGSDLQFSGKSGTTAMQVCSALIDSQMAKTALVIGSDTLNRHTCPGKVYEYTASAAAVALVIGNDDPLVKIEGTCSYASDLSDFFRIEGDRYIQNTGNGSEPYPAWEIGFVEHSANAAQAMMQKLDRKPDDYTFVVFQQPYGFVPYAIGERLGFTRKQIEPGVVAPMIGDCGAASSLLGLANVLDVADSSTRILLVSYGFGAGSDAFSLEVTPAIAKRRPKLTVTKYLNEKKKMVDYATACRLEYKYMQDTSPLHI